MSASHELPTLAVIGSPFLTARYWLPVASALRESGLDVVTGPSHSPLTVSDPAAVLEAMLDAIPAGDVVLALHSNAGLYAAEISRRRTVRGIVFVDAGIPAERGPQPIAPARLVAQVRPLADEEGILPPWNAWFDRADIADLFPDAIIEERLTDGLPRVALSYLDSRLVIRPGWIDAIRGAYLAFGQTYADELGRARDYGWPTTVLEGHHLHMLIDPDTVALELLALVRACCAYE